MLEIAFEHEFSENVNSLTNHYHVCQISVANSSYFQFISQVYTLTISNLNLFLAQEIIHNVEFCNLTFWQMLCNKDKYFVFYCRVLKAYKSGHYVKLFQDLIEYEDEWSSRGNETHPRGFRQLTLEERNLYAWNIIGMQCNWILARAMNIVRFVDEMINGFFDPKQTTLSEKIFPRPVVEQVYDEINSLIFPKEKIGYYKEDLFKHVIPCVRYVSVEATKIQCYFKTVPFNQPIEFVPYNEFIDGVRENLEEGIEGNKEIIEQNKEVIEKNKVDIGDNKEKITANEGKIGANAEEISDNDDELDKAENENEINMILNGSQFGLMGGYVILAFLLNKFRPNIPGPLQDVARVFSYNVGHVVSGGTNKEGENGIDLKKLDFNETELGLNVSKVLSQMNVVHEEICELKRRVKRD